MFGLGASDGWVITQYGETLATLPSEVEAMRWLLRRQSQSIDWAARNEGYDLLRIKDDQILFSYRRDIIGKEIEKAVEGKLNLEVAAELFEESAREAFIRVYGLPSDLGKIEQSIKSSYLPASKKLGWTKPDPNVVLVLTEFAWVPDPFNSAEDYENWGKVSEILRAMGWSNAWSDSINAGVQVVYWRKS